MPAHKGANWLATRRHFLSLSGAGIAALAANQFSADSAESKATSAPKSASPMHLGLVTYNLAKDWELATLIKNCELTGFEGVELRTTHAHKVEVGLSKAERETVQKRFADSKVQLVSMGSAFEYHTPDQTRLRKEIEATKEYIQLAHDVGATGVKVRPNGLPKEVPVEKTLEQIGKALRELGEYGSGLGQQIRLEVHGSGTSLVPHIRTILDVADHPNVGACWNSNQTDLDGKGFEHNFELIKKKIFTVHMRDLYLEEYPWRKLLTGLRKMGFQGFCFAEIGESTDPLRVMRYFRALWLAYQSEG